MTATKKTESFGGKWCSLPLKTSEKLSLAACGSFCCEKYFFDLKAMFFVNFRINAQQ